MDESFRYSLVLSASILCSTLLPSSYPTEAQAIPAAASSPELKESLEQFLQSTYRDDIKYGAKIKYYAAFRRDLNDDKKLEAIVYMYGNGFCGSGGCRTLIIERDKDSWKSRGEITITWPPIIVLRDKNYGWHSIAVWAEGGGTEPGYEAAVPFKGTGYGHPGNPTVPPSRPLKPPYAGKIVISADMLDPHCQILGLGPWGHRLSCEAPGE